MFPNHQKELLAPKKRNKEKNGPMEKILVPSESSRRADSETPKLFRNRSSFDRFTAVRSFAESSFFHFFSTKTNPKNFRAHLWRPFRPTCSSNLQKCQ